MKFILLLVFLLQSLLVGDSNYKSYINDGPSMVPTIYDGDRLLVNTDTSEGIKRDDLIIFKTEEKSYCKRVIGLTGDQIEINKTGIFVNNKLIKETSDLGLPDSKIIIKDNEYYVVGDNTGNSIDSRFLGPISDTQIIGKVVKIFHTRESSYD
ncbi:signal peptidase I [Paenibacillus vini]|uniref:signal peptidase I n=1 Tax=Paenibacillus vini TaxID=1476024 RepID=UPI0025B6A8BE|nr:signal peptidase I [Paenibacillus vini]MDN4070271.1 signal peptidase I [Paenibacillus vini]